MCEPTSTAEASADWPSAGGKVSQPAAAAASGAACSVSYALFEVALRFGIVNQ